MIFIYVYIYLYEKILAHSLYSGLLPHPGTPERLTAFNIWHMLPSSAQNAPRNIGSFSSFSSQLNCLFLRSFSDWPSKVSTFPLFFYPITLFLSFTYSSQSIITLFMSSFIALVSLSPTGMSAWGGQGLCPLFLLCL